MWKALMEHQLVSSKRSEEEAANERTERQIEKRERDGAEIFNIIFLFLFLRFSFW